MSVSVIGYYAKLIYKSFWLCLYFSSVFVYQFTLFLMLSFLLYFLVEVKQNKLEKSLLDTKNVYILDCSTDVFVWYVLLCVKILLFSSLFF